MKGIAEGMSGSAKRGKSRRVLWAVVGFGVLVIGAGIAMPRLTKVQPAHAAVPPSIPVVAATAGRLDTLLLVALRNNRARRRVFLGGAWRH
jgi:hypothetical protein